MRIPLPLFHALLWAVSGSLAGAETIWTAAALDPVQRPGQGTAHPPPPRGSAAVSGIASNAPYLEMKPGGDAVSVPLPVLPIGLYSLQLVGYLDPQGRSDLDRIWKPCPIDFEAAGNEGTRRGSGRLLAKQAFFPRVLQQFSFHVDQPGPGTARFRLPPTARETIRLVEIRLLDTLADQPDQAIKTRASGPPALYDTQTGEPVPTPGFEQPNRPETLDDARRQRDDQIWAALPPLNLHLQTHDPPPAWRLPPGGKPPFAWSFAAYEACRSASGQYRRHLYHREVFSPLDLLNRTTGERFPAADILASMPLPGGQPDDGTGLYEPASPDGAVPARWSLDRAQLLGERYRQFLGACMDSGGSFAGLNLPDAYLRQNDPQVGHDAAMALARLVYDWPALEMAYLEPRLCTHSPDLEFQTDWSNPARRNGKLYYAGWSGTHTVALLQAYDRLFPFLDGNAVFADALGRFIPWIRTPRDVIRFFDRYLVWTAVRDQERGLARAAPIAETAAQILGPSPASARLFDLTRIRTEIYPYAGPFSDLYATALTRSGCYPIGSFLVYAFGSACDTLQRADLVRQFREAGAPTPFDLSDVQRYPKVRKAGDFLIDMFVAGGFPFMVGDASGGPHTGSGEGRRRLKRAAEASRAAVALWGDPRHAWLLRHLHGDPDPRLDTLAAGVRDPLLHPVSRVVPDYGAILEFESEATDPQLKTAATLRLGVGQGHAHQDFLDLNLFGLGLPLAVDLACRSEGHNWSRPPASWAFLHNHALAHDSEDPKKAGGRGEPWLTAFAPPILRVSFENENGRIRLARSLLILETDGGGRYAVDLQRLSGGAWHTWCFHGCESDTLTLNTPMTPGATRWTDRLLDGTQKRGVAPPLLEAVWTMSRQGRVIPHTFDGGGQIHTVGAEPAVLGANYDPERPPVRVRARLAGRQGDAVLQGDPYSEQYAYAFPFLWVQHAAASNTTLYPAVYDWYRGNSGTVAQVDPVSVSGPTAIVRIVHASGAVDTVIDEVDGLCGFTACDPDGRLREAAVVNGRLFDRPDAGLQVRLDQDQFEAVIEEIDYTNRRLRTSAPLPAEPGVVAGGPGRWIWLTLQGAGTRFSWNDDLLVHQSAVTAAVPTGPETMKIQTRLDLFHGDSGNRKRAAFTVTTEDGAWHFRDGRVIRKPAEGELTPDIFRDTSGDGTATACTYEIGLGNRIRIPARVHLRRRPDGMYEIRANTAGEITLHGRTVRIPGETDWMPLPFPPAQTATAITPRTP